MFIMRFTGGKIHTLSHVKHSYVGELQSLYCKLIIISEIGNALLTNRNKLIYFETETINLDNSAIFKLNDFVVINNLGQIVPCQVLNLTAETKPRLIFTTSAFSVSLHKKNTYGRIYQY